MSKDENYTNVILEEMNGKFDLLVEAVGTVQEKLETLALKKDLTEVKEDVKMIRAAVTDHSGEFQEHGRRLTQFEAT